jgi:hypothetical protein
VSGSHHQRPSHWKVSLYPEPVKKIRSWFDALTTSGVAPMEIKELAVRPALSKGNGCFFHSFRFKKAGFCCWPRYKGQSVPLFEKVS